MFRFSTCICLLLYSLSVFSNHTGIHEYNKTGVKKKPTFVEKTPYQYEYPTGTTSTDTRIVEKPWIVYSDRNNNTVYSDPILSKPLSKINLLDSFYVLSMNEENMELIKYNAKNILSTNEILNIENIEYVGWISRSQLLLNEKSFLNVVSKLPKKYITLLHGSQIFNGLLTNWNPDEVPVYIDPELTALNNNTNLFMNEIVYVYKKHKEHVLIGKTNHFSTKNVSNVIIGWVHISFIQAWSTRLCLEAVDIQIPDTLIGSLFLAKNQAMNFESNASIGVPLSSPQCGNQDQIYSKYPVFNIEKFTKNNVNYSLIKTGVVINPFDNNNAFIYNVNGTKIHNSTVCELIDNSKKINIVFAINMDNNTKDYYTDLISSLQKLETYFNNKTEKELHFGLVNCADTNLPNAKFEDSYSSIMRKLITITKESVQFKQSASTFGIINGLSHATAYFKNRAHETNIIIMISSQGDDAVSEPSYKLKTEKLITELAQYNTRVVFFQPYSTSGNEYASFVPQTKTLLQKYAEKEDVLKRNVQITTTKEQGGPRFKNIESGAVNTYCLDFPKTTSSQGFLLFPTIGSKADGIYLSTALDSLFNQITFDTKTTTAALNATFNSSSIFNTKPNTYFERYYNMYEPTPNNMETACKNINFNYFSEGYIVIPNTPEAQTTYFKQRLLLTEEEYDEMYHVFKYLKIDILKKEPTEINKNKTLAAFNTLANNYSVKKDQAVTNGTFANFFYETCGYYPATPLLNRLYVNYMIDPKYTSTESYNNLVLHLMSRCDKFYSIKNDNRFSFVSNGMKYYWVYEDYLP